MSQDLVAELQRIVDANIYLTLGTVNEDGRPWTTPVFFAADAYRDFYWISSPDVIHSQNLARRPDVSFVVFDSSAPAGTGAAVYMAGQAVEVTDAAERENGLIVYPGTGRGGRTIRPEEVQPPGPYRLYRATASQHWILCPLEGGGKPCEPHGLAYDHRIEVPMP